MQRPFERYDERQRRGRKKSGLDPVDLECGTAFHCQRFLVRLCDACGEALEAPQRSGGSDASACHMQYPGLCQPAVMFQESLCVIIWKLYIWGTCGDWQSSGPAKVAPSTHGFD